MNNEMMDIVVIFLNKRSNRFDLLVCSSTVGRRLVIGRMSTNINQERAKVNLPIINYSMIFLQFANY